MSPIPPYEDRLAAGAQLVADPVRGLADEVSAAVHANEARLAQAAGEIKIVVWRKAGRCDIDLTVTTRAQGRAPVAGPGRIRRLADEVRAKITARRALLAESHGPVTLRMFPRGQGFDIELNVTV